MESPKFHSDKEARVKAERKRLAEPVDPPLSRRRILVKWMEAEKPGGGANPYNPVSNPSSSRSLTGHLPRSLSFCPFIARTDRRDSSHRQIGGAVSFQNRTFPRDRTAALLRPLFLHPLLSFQSYFPSILQIFACLELSTTVRFSKFNQLNNWTFELRVCII